MSQSPKVTHYKNFAIIAHVDHGKSTLADRLLELTGTVEKDKHHEQLLDRNPISRERGITIKLAPVRMSYSMKINDGWQNYQLNLIDTPGHVDFSYEVERTLACVEGAILLVDATQGIQAQTIAHTYKAFEQDLTLIPAINKIDMPQARIEETKDEMAKFLGINPDDIFEISAKTGKGVQELFEHAIQEIPEPTPLETATENVSRGLIFDSYYDTYRGVIGFVRVFEGAIKARDELVLAATNEKFEVEEVGSFVPDLVKLDSLQQGSIGYVVTKLKDIHTVHVGDTMMTPSQSAQPIKGYKEVNPMVFSSVFPTDPDDFPDLTVALEKLSLNDSALQFEPVSSKALGSGYRVGFLGLLHADVVRQRIEDEYDLSIVLTAPTVEYKTSVTEHGVKEKIAYEEPIARVTIVTPQEYSGAIMQLCEEARGDFINMDNAAHVVLEYDIPLSELISYFFDRLKTISSGFASLQWEFNRYQPVDVDKLVLLLNLEPVDEFSEYVVSARAYRRGRELVDRLKELIPRQQFEVKIQAQYKGKIIASSRIAPYRKDVTAKLYGGDRTRKDKLLKKQKAGKKKMKHVGSVEVPKEVFMKVFESKS